MGNLAVSGKFSIDPKIKAGIHPFKIQETSLFELLSFQQEGAGIHPTGVILWNIRWVIGKWIAHIGILMAVVSLCLPAGRNLDFSK